MSAGSLEMLNNARQGENRTFILQRKFSECLCPDEVNCQAIQGVPFPSGKRKRRTGKECLLEPRVVHQSQD